MDKFGAVDAYCTFEYKRTQQGQEPPEQDGHRTQCMDCEDKNEFAKSVCKEHRSDTAQKSFQPQFNRKFKIKLDSSKSILLFGVYSWNRSGGHPLIGYLRMPVWAVLYSSEVEREYPLMSYSGSKMKAVGVAKDGSTFDTFAKIKIRWRYVYKKRSSKTEYAQPGTMERMLNGCGQKKSNPSNHCC